MTICSTPSVMSLLYARSIGGTHPFAAIDGRGWRVGLGYDPLASRFDETHLEGNRRVVYTASMAEVAQGRGEDGRGESVGSARLAAAVIGLLPARYKELLKTKQ